MTLSLPGFEPSSSRVTEEAQTMSLGVVGGGSDGGGGGVGATVGRSGPAAATAGGDDGW